MNIIDIFFTSSQGLKERKFRFFLNLVGIMIGCAAVTGLISLTQGLNDEVSGMLETFGPNNIMIIPGRLEMGAGIIASQSFTWKDLDTIEKISELEVVTPITGNKMAQFTNRGESKYAYVYGVNAEYFEIMSGYQVEEGRALKRGDSAVVVLGYELAYPKNRERPLVEVGDRITLIAIVDGYEKETNVRVVGIMERMGGLGGVSSDEDNSLYIPLKTCQQFYEVGGGFQFVAAKVKDIDDVPETVQKLEKRLGNEVTIMTADNMREMVGSILGAIEAVLGGVAAISLIVAGVGIINTMTISVMERTKEIGILKAIGAKSRDVLLMFLSEAILTGLIGGAFGACVGFLLGGLVGRYIEMPVSNSVFLGLGVVIFSITTSAISGLYPAWRASNLHPVEALRSE